jgi:uracil-DNA glycosylase family 4
MTVSSTSIKRKHHLAVCEECPLYKERISPTAGPKDAKVAIVSRSPGYHDVRGKNPRPFNGPSGKIIEFLLGKYGHKREEVLTTNVVLCYHDGPPPKEAIRACKPRLDSEIDNCSTVIAAGSEPVAALTRRASLDGARGYEHERTVSWGKQRVIATNNPVIVLRDDSTFPNLVRDFRLALAPLPPPTLPTVDWTNNVSEGRRWLQLIAKQQIDLLSVDIETKGLRSDAQLVAVGFSGAGDKAISFGERVCGDDYTYRNYIGPLVAERRSSQYLYHNGKFDVRNFRYHGINARVDEDTMLLSWALDERSDEGQVHKLEYLLMNELNWPNYEPAVVVAWKKKVGKLEKELRFDELRELPTPDELYEYNALDAAGTAQLFPILKERAIRDNVWERPYRSLLIPASERLVTVELEGIDFDVERAFDMLEDEVWPKLDNWREELRLIVGDGSYNPNSTTQNSKLVYDDWKIQHALPIKAEERSVDKSVYTEIKAGRFLVGTLESRVQDKQIDGAIRSQSQYIKDTAIRWADRFADFKQLDKQRSTYIEGVIPVAIHNGGKLYTNFKEHNTVTGRLTSSGPNLQNITRTKPDLPNIRSLFIAPDGFTLLNADYSQAEMRAIANLSGAKKLVRIYEQRESLHAYTAERFFGQQYTKENYQTAKNMNFGVPYGQSAETFQEKHDIPVKLGEEFIEWWKSEFPEVWVWRDEVAKEVRTGAVVSPFGNKRRNHIRTPDNIKALIREGVNFLPQTTAAYLTLVALMQLVDSLDSARVILTVHDSILLRVPNNILDSVAPEVVRRMVEAPKQALDWDFPFEAEVQIGQNWGELKDLEL